jgi:uncharacterized protein YndB with AHSA1/START domain
MTTKDQSASTADREIVVTRLLNAPRELVWQAWTTPEHLARWWGPRGFKNTTREIEIKPGGVWKFIMHGPDGRDYPNQIVFRELVKPERISYAHSGDGGTVMFSTTVTLEDQGGKTKLVMRAVFATAAERDLVVREYGAAEGAEQHIDRLTEQVAKYQFPEPFTISRTLEAPRELVWKVCTQAEHLQHWWGPRGFKVTVAKLDFRPGGIFHYAMHLPSGDRWWGRMMFREIEAPKRILFINSFSDESGGLIRHPGHQGWPMEMLSEFAFTEQEGKTTLKVTWYPYNATDSERQTFDENRPSMNGGWTGTLDNLTEYLAQTKG